jgi:pimeloyl-ACP methyl ester carboxylesterase
MLRPVQEVITGGVTIVFEEAGDLEAPPVVLLHGFTADNRMWLPCAEFLSEDYRVIAPDMRGHGLSSAPEELEAYTIEAYAEDIKNLLDSLEVDVCVLIGCSFGGMVALQFATTWPERLAGLVISDSSAAYDHPEYDDAYRQREARIDAQADIVDRFGTAELGKRAARDIEDPFIAEGLRKRYARMSREGFLGAAQVRRQRGNLLPVLRERLTMPVLVCIGEDDPVRSAANVMVRELPAARYLTFKATGHGIPAARPESFAREVLRFFADIEEGREITARATVS